MVKPAVSQLECAKLCEILAFSGRYSWLDCKTTVNGPGNIIPWRWWCQKFHMATCQFPGFGMTTCTKGLARSGLFILSTVVLACKNRLGRGEAEKNCRSASRGKSKKRVSWVLRTWAECSLQTSTRSIQCSWQKDSRPKPVVFGDLLDQELNPIGKWNKELQARALVNGCLKQLRSLICPKAVREDPEAW